jgi:hypothetical protein
VLRKLCGMGRPVFCRGVQGTGFLRVEELVRMMMSLNGTTSYSVADGLEANCRKTEDVSHRGRRATTSPKKFWMTNSTDSSGLALIQFSARSLSLIGIGAGSVTSRPYTACDHPLTHLSLLPANVARGRSRVGFPRAACERGMKYGRWRD